jgi:hypothetical protein
MSLGVLCARCRRLQSAGRFGRRDKSFSKSQLSQNKKTLYAILFMCVYWREAPALTHLALLHLFPKDTWTPTLFFMCRRRWHRNHRAVLVTSPICQLVTVCTWNFGACFQFFVVICRGWKCCVIKCNRVNLSLCILTGTYSAFIGFCLRHLFGKI